MQLSRPHSWCLKTGTMASMNVLVDKDLRAKLADFAGGQSTARLFLLLTASHQYPEPLLCFQGDLSPSGVSSRRP